MTKKPKKRSRKSDKPKFEADMLCYVLLQRFIILESSYYFKVEQTHICEWYYRSTKNSEHIESRYSISDGRDKKAFRATESFRKRFFKPFDELVLTEDFLFHLVTKLKIFGPFTDWKHFVETFKGPLEGFIMRNIEMYRQYVLRARDYGSAYAPTEYYCFIFANEIFDAYLQMGHVTWEDADHVAIAANPEVLVIKATPNYFPVLKNIERYRSQYLPLFNHDKELLHAVNPNMFYWGLDQERKVRDSISIFPMNSKFIERMMDENEKFPRVILPDWICTPDKISETIVLLLELGSFPPSSAFDVLMARILKDVLQHHPADLKKLVFYIVDDTPYKQGIISKYGFVPTKFLINSKSLSLDRVAQRLYWDVTTYKIFAVSVADFMDRATGNTFQ